MSLSDKWQSTLYVYEKMQHYYNYAHYYVNHLLLFVRLKLVRCIIVIITVAKVYDYDGDVYYLTYKHTFSMALEAWAAPIPPNPII